MNNPEKENQTVSAGKNYSSLKRLIKGRAYQITHMLQSNQMKLDQMEAEVKIFDEQVTDPALKELVNTKMHSLRLQVAAQMDRSMDEIDLISTLCNRINKLVIETVPPIDRARFMLDPVTVMEEASVLARQVLHVAQR